MTRKILVAGIIIAAITILCSLNHRSTKNIPIFNNDTVELSAESKAETDEDTTIKTTITETQKTTTTQTTTTTKATESSTSKAETTTKVTEKVMPSPQADKSSKQLQISLDMDISKPTDLSKEEFVSLMNNLKYDSKGYFKRNAETIWELCHENGLNEIAACGIIAQESGWAKVAGWGKNNYFGIYGGKYATEEAGLKSFVELVAKQYLSEGGKFYKGKTLHAVGLTYCDGNKWPKEIFRCMKLIVECQ